MPASKWTAQRFLDLLGNLGRLRVISVCGPSVFEALCSAGPYQDSGGSLNMFTDEFHWHLDTKRFSWLRSHDETHLRSKRRVLYFSLYERNNGIQPFLKIYVDRPAGAEFESNVETAFMTAHAELTSGQDVVRGPKQ